MVDPLSVISADIHMVRTEENVEKAMNLLVYKRFVGTIYRKTESFNKIYYLRF